MENHDRVVLKLYLFKDIEHELLLKLYVYLLNKMAHCGEDLVKTFE